MEKLKPCPFCGGEAVMQAPNMHHVTCIACRDCMVSSKWGKPEDVVAMWNKRVEPTAKSALDNLGRESNNQA